MSVNNNISNNKNNNTSANPFSKASNYEAIPDHFCNICNRKYNEDAYSRHLTGCEKRNKINQIKNKGKK